MGRFRDALAEPGLRAIAEVKRRSPSAGDLRPDADAPALARSFGESGAAAVSILLPLPDTAWLLAVLVVAAGMAYGAFWVPAMAILSRGVVAVRSGAITPSFSRRSSPLVLLFLLALFAGAGTGIDPEPS